MTNLDSIFKSRDITLPTRVRLVKAMVFPAVMYGCESWTVKKAERPQLEETPETPPSSRAEGLLFLHGLESNPESSLQTPQEA